MGFFSWKCNHCHKEILAPYPHTKWSEVVVLTQGGSILMGTYDGYGRVDSMDVLDACPQFYHSHCWDEAGKPLEHTGESEPADAQGYFLSPKELRENYPIEDGWKFYDNCPSCNGYGYIDIEEDPESSGDCPRCNGQGAIPYEGD